MPSAVPCARSLARRIVLEWGRCDLVIRVWDGSTDMPARRDAGPESEHGRGLMLVESLSKQWGACLKPAGKIVWVQI
jgi:hypothetical protein